MAKNLVIVESPAKAKTINRYLGKDYIVKASFGHIRDLPKSKIGVDVDNDFAPKYVMMKDKSKVVKELKDAAKKADHIYLAADQDREGESICFHIMEILKDHADSFIRVTFNEITKSAIQAAFKNPTVVDMDKVEAQQARRILDRLVGYKLSPLLWDKVRRGLSAGRVQSVALKLITERETEIKAFNIEEYWSITADVLGNEKPSFKASLHSQKGKKFIIGNEKQATGIVDELKKSEFEVSKVTIKPRKRNAPAPFITSSLQQDAFRKLGYSVARTMRLAQKLYEGVDLGSEGQVALITYMRTDSTHISEEAKTTSKDLILEKFGKEYLSTGGPKRKKVKGAQEAHEAIRPTYIDRTPESVEDYLELDLFKLYKLIWNRLVASQMSAAVFEATSIDIAVKDYLFRASGSRLVFPGYQKVLGMSGDDDKDAFLPKIEKGEKLKLNEILPAQHFTQPPARFSEAGLVRELENRGIGRPSTYASIISTIISREYVERENKRLQPTDLGMVVTELLAENFTELMNYEYTALVEAELDKVEDGKENWVNALRLFYDGFAEALEKAESGMRNLKAEVEETDEKCPKCEAPVNIRWGRFGKFKSCSKYPDCDFTSPLDGSGEGEEGGEQGPLGDDPKTGKPIFLRKGPYGHYIQLGEKDKENPKPKRVSLPRGKKADDIDFRYAVDLISLPRELGKDPESGEPIVTAIGRYGPFVNRGKKFQSLKDPDLIFTLTLEEALKMLAKPSGNAELKSLGNHPKTDIELKIKSGRFGPYVTDGKINASIPKKIDPNDLTMDEAVELLIKAADRKKAKGKK
jgi:DNA topoisomerase-1